jgi:hypothetical protein
LRWTGIVSEESHSRRAEVLQNVVLSQPPILVELVVWMPVEYGIEEGSTLAPCQPTIRNESRHSEHSPSRGLGMATATRTAIGISPSKDGHPGGQYCAHLANAHEHPGIREFLCESFPANLAHVFHSRYRRKRPIDDAILRGCIRNKPLNLSMTSSRSPSTTTPCVGSLTRK